MKNCLKYSLFFFLSEITSQHVFDFLFPNELCICIHLSNADSDIHYFIIYFTLVFLFLFLFFVMHQSRKKKIEKQKNPTKNVELLDNVETVSNACNVRLLSVVVIVTVVLLFYMLLLI